MILNAVWRLFAATILFALSFTGAQAQGSYDCGSPDPALPVAAVERWLGQQASPGVVLEAIARAAASPLWIDEIAISAGKALVKGHVDGPDRAAELEGLARRLQQSASVRGAPDVTWLDDKGLPGPAAGTPGFLFQVEGVPQAGRAAGRSAVSCDLVGAVVANFVALPVMNGTRVLRFKPQRELTMEGGLPVQVTEVTVAGRFIDLVNLLRAWEALPVAIALDAVVVAPRDDALEMALTIKVIRGVARVGGRFAGGDRVGDVKDPFRRAEMLMMDRGAPVAPSVCSARAKAWAGLGRTVSYHSVVAMPGIGPRGLFRVGSGGLYLHVRVGDPMADIGARVTALAPEAAELEVAEQVGDTCQLRTVRLPVQRP